MYPYIKRGADVILSLLALICLSPVYLIVALAVKISSPGPVLFRQKRVGRGGRLFTIYKFRTMRTDTPRDTATHLLKDPARYITGVGAFLRRSSLDELPQFFNVLKGDMSIVGPRPALYNQDDLIAARREAGVDAVRPGITGWAQVNGLRGDTSIEERVKYDIWYIENWSLSLDIKIVWKTVFGGLVNAETVKKDDAVASRNAL